MRMLKAILRIVGVGSGCVTFALCQPAPEIPKEWRGKTATELLALPEIGRMPFVAQDQIFGTLNPAHRSLPWTERQIPLLAAERERALVENRKPLIVRVWSKGGVGIDYFTDGEHYYAILSPPFFLSVKVAEYEKYVRAWVYLSNDKGSDARYDLFA